MISDSKKISLRQAILLFLTITFTPAIRIIPVYGAEKAKQAAWLAPSVTVVMLFLLALIWQTFCKKYKNYSLMDIYSDITGGFIGKMLAVVHLVWMTILIGIYIRYFGVRLTASVYPSISLEIFSICLLVVIAYTLRFGLTTLARLNEVFLPILSIVFYILIALMLPNIKIGFLTPISHRSVLPVLSVSSGIIGILSYFTFVFIIGDRINNKENVKRAGISAALFLFVAWTVIVAVTLGLFSYSVVQRVQLPFLAAVKQISLFNTLERIESIVVSLWVISDFVLISFFTFCVLHILKYLFKLKATKPFINIYLVLTFVLSNYVAKSVFELENLSRYILIPGNIILGFILPVVIFVIGKIRRKI